MSNTFIPALATQLANQDILEVHAQNIANASTPGYQAASPMFREVFTGAQNLPPTVFANQTLVSRSGTRRRTAVGDANITDNKLDFYIAGPGYFGIQTPRGLAYTKNGHFKLSPDKQIVTTQGYQVLDEGAQPITLPEGVSAEDLIVDAQGLITAKGQNIAKIGVNLFEKQQTFDIDQEGFFLTDQEALPPVNENGIVLASVMNGALDTGNVQVITETLALLEAQKSAQRTIEIIRMEDQRIRDGFSKIMNA